MDVTLFLLSLFFFSFNHTQFLCYGLLKIVLKEYIQKMENYPENTLCSYFIKTDVLDDSRYSNWTVATKELSDLLCNVFYTFDISCKKEECPFFLPSRSNMLNNKATEKNNKDTFTEYIWRSFENGTYELYCKMLQLFFHPCSLWWIKVTLLRTNAIFTRM